MDTQLAGFAPSRARRSAFLSLLRILALPLLAAVLAGCASGGGGVGKAFNRTLESVGLREIDHDERAGIRTLPLRLYAGDNLNAGNGDRALATVVRIYHLRGIQRFEQTPFDAFMDETREQAALGSELVQAREVVLTPGMRQQFDERLSAETTHVAVVALFRAPASSRWRFAFDARHGDVERDGITVGLHACALSSGSPALASSVPGDAASLVAARCSG
ncbi:type VI secretion system lipoprotein TssJ [Luteimonas dalianensis]|uniref:type VI secretion system lipoprotein TssJ n=1 Tax=Luteimonas dalianensis TaxID=1148196 RepID=UPI003BF187B8